MNHYKSFKVEDGEISKISKRLTVRNVKLVSISVLIVTVIQYFKWGKDEPIFFSVIFCVMVLISGVSIMFGTVISRRGIKNFEFGFDNRGVFIKSSQLTKSILWSNIEVNSIRGNVVKLADKSIPKYKRILFGVGVYRIPYEIYQRSELLSEISSRN